MTGTLDPLAVLEPKKKKTFFMTTMEKKVVNGALETRQCSGTRNLCKFYLH